MPDALSDAVNEVYQEALAGTGEQAEGAPVDDLMVDDSEPEADGGEDADGVTTEEGAEPDDDGEGDDDPVDDEDLDGDQDDDDDADDEGDEDDDGDGEDGPVAVAEDATYVLPDGTEVSGSELRDGWLRQADYTRKTQALAKQRKDVESMQKQISDWIEERQSDPGKWVLEIAGDNPPGVLAEAISSTEDPTSSLAWTIRTLAERGKLDEQFVQQFGLDEVAGKGLPPEQEDRIAKLERELREERERQSKDERTQQILETFNSQWDSIKTSEGLEYQSPAEEQAAKLDLMRFARDAGIPNLEHAWAASRYRQTRQQQVADNSADDDARKRASEHVAKKKKKARAVNRAPSQQAAPKTADPNDLDAVIRETFRESGEDV